jgi:protein-tyrosine-phosphatase
MAEGLFRNLVRDRFDIQVQSAGLAALDGAPPSEHAIQVMSELGLDISGQRSQMLDSWLIDQSDYIFVMTRSHQAAIRRMRPAAAEKTFLVKEFLGSSDEPDVADPIGFGISTYRVCRDEIAQALPSVLEFIEKTRSADETN